MLDRSLYFYEKSQGVPPLHTFIALKYKKHLYSGKSPYQKVDFYETYDHGILFALDDVLMCTERDEFVYHESMAFISSLSHPNPRSVLVIGGGDGGLIWQLTKLPSFEKIDLCEIDPLVVEKSREFFPYLKRCEALPQVKIHIQDGFDFLKENKHLYDIILVDSTDPIGEAKKLFDEDFFTLIHKSLKEDGIFITQSGSPFYTKEFLSSNLKKIEKVFSYARIFTSPCHSYPGGYWGFIFGSKKYTEKNFQDIFYNKVKDSLEYYTKGIHFAAFEIPNYLKKIL